MCVYTPFMKQVQTPRGVAVVPDAAATWTWMMGLQLPFPPGVAFDCMVTNSAQSADNRPTVYCVQMSPPAVERSYVNAPTMQPVGNPGAPSSLPVANQPRTVPAGAYEEIPHAALPGADAMMDMDPAGGTYTDVTLDGKEVQRDVMSPYAPRVPGR